MIINRKDNIKITSEPIYDLSKDNILSISSIEWNPNKRKSEKLLVSLVERLGDRKIKLMIDNDAFSYNGINSRIENLDILKYNCLAIAILAVTKNGQCFSSIFYEVEKLNIPVKVFFKNKNATAWLNSKKFALKLGRDARLESLN
jgi:hypothetical protein